MTLAYIYIIAACRYLVAYLYLLSHIKPQSIQFTRDSRYITVEYNTILHTGQTANSKAKLRPHFEPMKGSHGCLSCVSGRNMTATNLECTIYTGFVEWSGGTQERLQANGLIGVVTYLCWTRNLTSPGGDNLRKAHLWNINNSKHLPVDITQCIQGDCLMFRLIWELFWCSVRI